MADSETKEILRYNNYKVNLGEVWAIIPARGGSKGLSHKNIRLLCGRPLIAHTISAACHCNEVSRCIVSTDDENIADISRELGAEILMRPPELATDTASSSSVVRHLLETYASDYGLPEFFILLQPTSPLRTAEHIRCCLKEFLDSDCSCAISVTEMEHHPFKAFVMENKAIRPLYSVDMLEKPRQILPRIYRQNGAIYIMNSLVFLENNSFFTEPAYSYVMSQEESVDIDNELDLAIAEFLMEKLKNCRAGLT